MKPAVSLRIVVTFSIVLVFGALCVAECEARVSSADKGIITSRAELNAYLRTSAKSGSPLDHLSPAARSRFLSSLQFGPNGLIGFRIGDLHAELSRVEIYNILRLFGKQEDTSMIFDVRVPGSEERAVTPRRPALLGGTPTAASANARPSPVESHFATLSHLEDATANLSERRASQIFSKEYEAFFAAQQRRSLRTMNSDDVSLFYRAAGLVWDYTLEPAYLRDMLLDLNELERRGAASQGQYDDAYVALVASTMFPQARALARRHPSRLMHAIPEYRDARHSGVPGPTVLVLSPDGLSLIRRSVDLTTAQVLVASSPSCHFCQLAVRDLEGDPTLREVFRTRATWLVRPDGTTGFDDIRRWNRQHPGETMVLAYRVQEWPMVDRWETPTFYFLNNGKVNAEVVGWAQSLKSEVRAGLRRVGLLSR